MSFSQTSFIFTASNGSPRQSSKSGKCYPHGFETICANLGTSRSCKSDRDCKWIVEATETRRRPPGERKLVLGHIGGRSAHKGAFLVEVILRQSRLTNLKLIMVDAAQVDYGQQVEQRWGETEVCLVGSYPQDNVNELYSRMDVLLAPSLWPESYGLVAWEALSLGLWVVASDRGAVGEGIVEGKNGYIVDVSNLKGLTAIFAQFNADPDYYKQVPSIRTEGRHSDMQGAELATLYRNVSK